MRKFKTNILLLTTLALSISFPTHAQKLPKIQEGSVLAPDNIKIDGKLTEWNDQLKAYNPGNFIFYTISNNDSYLYLTVRMSGEYGNQKILSGGLTFTVTDPSKNEAGRSVTYPALTRPAPRPRGTPNYPIEVFAYNPGVYKTLMKDSINNKDKIDSLIISSNKQIRDFFKDIQLSGMKEIADPVISVFNPDGIRVAASFNDHMEFIYELAIPVKYLGDAVIKSGELKYNIMLNPEPTIAVKGVAYIPPPKNDRAQCKS